MSLLLDPEMVGPVAHRIRVQICVQIRVQERKNWMCSLGGRGSCCIPGEI